MFSKNLQKLYFLLLYLFLVRSRIEKTAKYNIYENSNAPSKYSDVFLIVMSNPFIYHAEKHSAYKLKKKKYFIVHKRFFLITNLHSNLNVNKLSVIILSLSLSDYEKVGFKVSHVGRKIKCANMRETSSKRAEALFVTLNEMSKQRHLKSKRGLFYTRSSFTWLILYK